MRLVHDGTNRQDILASAIQMVNPIPMNVNQFIEQQLNDCVRALEDATNSDVLGFQGGLIGGVDDLFRAMIEDKKQTLGSKDKLSLILTTSGGYIEIVQRIVDTLRHHYRTVDFIIPNYALSAGTVFAMSGDAILMDYYSVLGPIDPQVENQSGNQVPALGYLIQWERLLEKAKKGSITLAEMQLMNQGFDQAELYQYEQARELSISLLKEWLVKYKFKNWRKTKGRGKPVTKKMKDDRAEAIAQELNNTDRWHVHGHGISMEILRRDLKLLIDDFGEDPNLRGKIRSYYSLLEDYMVKMGNRGVIHTADMYRPII